MKTLKEIYNPPAPTAAEIYRWSETLKFGQWSALPCSTGTIMWARENTGIISASSGPSVLMGRLRLRKSGPTVAWPGSPPPAVVPCEPEIEGAETESQREQMGALLDHVRGTVRQWLWNGEWDAIVDSRKAVKAEVSELRRKANVLGKKDCAGFRERSKALARFVQVREVCGLRVCYWSERGCWHVADFHTGQGIGVPSVKAKAGMKREAVFELMESVRVRVSEFGFAAMIETLNQFPVVNQPGGEAVS
jgi:hypothetical protein